MARHDSHGFSDRTPFFDCYLNTRDVEFIGIRCQQRIGQAMIITMREPPGPPTYYYHYSDPAAIGALLYQVGGVFPETIDTDHERLVHFYSDSLSPTWRERLLKAGMGECDLYSPALGSKDTRRMIATLIGDDEHNIKHIRARWWESSGYPLAEIEVVLNWLPKTSEGTR